MKRLLTIISVFLVSLVSLAQTPEDKVLKFLGIPVDGPKANMIAELKKKDFIYDSRKDCLTGKFNGIESEIFISTNYGKVDRIIVADAHPTDETNIRIRYNNLMAQMDKNKKYISMINSPIPEKEDISYEMTVNNKRYEASYTYAPGLDPDQVKDNILEKLSLNENDDIDSVDKEKLFVAMFSVIQEYSTGNVWFTIVEQYGRYVIAMYYENMANRPNGDDL